MAQKKITDLDLISSVTGTLNFPVDNAIQTYRATAAQMLDYIDDNILTNDTLGLVKNVGFTASVAANALTIALKNAAGSNPSAGVLNAVQIAFRNATVTTGTPVVRSVTGALSLVVSSGSTLGHKSAVEQIAYIYAIDNAGTVELAISSKLFDDGAVISTTSEGGAGSADSASVAYSTSARSNVPSRLIGRIKSTQATAGTWATAISELSLAPFQAQGPRSSVRVHTSNGYGSTNNKIRRFTTTVTSFGTGITYADSAADGGSFTINEDGIYGISFTGNANAAASDCGISLNSSQLTTGIGSITAADRLALTTTQGSSRGAFTSWCGFLQAGDVIRAHTDGTATGTAALDTFTITKVEH